MSRSTIPSMVGSIESSLGALDERRLLNGIYVVRRSTAIALSLTFPLWLTVNYLGAPDNGAILAAYFGSLLMAGGFLAVGAFVSALTKNQVIAFVLSLVSCLAIVFLGFPGVIDLISSWAPEFLVDTVRSFSFLTHFAAITRGVVEARDLLFFLSLIALFLYANVVFVDLRKAH